jgi:hypothetical protein
MDNSGHAGGRVCVYPGTANARLAVLAAAALAVALDTKINAAFLPIILLPGRGCMRAAEREQPLCLGFSCPAAGFSAVAVAGGIRRPTECWPISILASRHPKLGLWFEGRKWNFQAEAAPWYYPLVITAVGIPR